MEKSSSSRRVCPGCKEELAPTAYYRHQTGTSCPGRKHERLPTTDPDFSGTDSEEKDCDESVSKHDIGLDSSFCISDCESVMQTDDNNAHKFFDSTDDEEEIDTMLEHESSTEDELSLEDGEIWDDCSNSSDEETAHTDFNEKKVVLGICLFLNFFQVFYKVSERAILALILFLKTLMSFFGLDGIAALLPKPLHSVKKALRNFQQQSVVDYVVCPKCNSLYLIEHCIVGCKGREESRLCEYVEYPRHTQLSRRNKCNTPLLKRVLFGKGGKLVPRKSFVYNDIISGLAAMVARKDFLAKCEHWRNRENTLPVGVVADIYEGRV